ncbi:hypothetical protein MP228_006366 [Amoeboaphelidium protococcarum]|nr:hypothetical protein MP228_006366 [Amoeboaphelidium protococcarum]
MADKDLDNKIVLQSAVDLVRLLNKCEWMVSQMVQKASGGKSSKDGRIELQLTVPSTGDECSITVQKLKAYLLQCQKYCEYLQQQSIADKYQHQVNQDRLAQYKRNCKRLLDIVLDLEIAERQQQQQQQQNAQLGQDQQSTSLQIFQFCQVEAPLFADRINATNSQDKEQAPGDNHYDGVISGSVQKQSNSKPQFVKSPSFSMKRLNVGHLRERDELLHSGGGSQNGGRNLIRMSEGEYNRKIAEELTEQLLAGSSIMKRNAYRQQEMINADIALVDSSILMSMDTQQNRLKRARTRIEALRQSMRNCCSLSSMWGQLFVILLSVIIFIWTWMFIRFGPDFRYSIARQNPAVGTTNASSIVKEL